VQYGAAFTLDPAAPRGTVPYSAVPR